MATSIKLDLYKLHGNEYISPRTPKLADVGLARYLANAGKGEPGGAAFTERLSALYNVAFTVKMANKFAGRHYAVCKLEGLWWKNKKQAAFFHLPSTEWRWKLISELRTLLPSKISGKPSTVFSGAASPAA